MEPVEVISAPVPPPVRSTPAKQRPEISIPEPGFAMSVLRKQDDCTAKFTVARRLPAPELRASKGAPLAVANPPAAVFDGVGHEIEVEVRVGVEKEAVAIGAQVCHIDGNATRSLLTRNFHQGFTRHGHRTRQI